MGEIVALGIGFTGPGLSEECSATSGGLFFEFSKQSVVRLFPALTIYSPFVYVCSFDWGIAFPLRPTTSCAWGDIVCLIPQLRRPFFTHCIISIPSSTACNSLNRSTFASTASSSAHFFFKLFTRLSSSLSS